MTARQTLDDLQQRSKQGPIVPDSTLYRALQRVARAIAKRLMAGQSESKQGGSRDSQERKTRQAQQLTFETTQGTLAWKARLVSSAPSSLLILLVAQ